MNWGPRPPWKDPHTQRALLLATLWLAILVAIVAIREVLLPVGIAVLLAYVLHPAVTWLNGRLVVRGRRMPRWGATLLLYGVMALTLYVGGRIFVPQVVREVASLGRVSGQLVRKMDAHVATLPARLTDLLAEYHIPVVLVWSSGDDEVPDETVAPEQAEDRHETAEAGTGPEAAETAPNGSAHRNLELDLRQELADAARDLSRVAGKAVTELVRRAQGAVNALVGFIFKLFLVLMLTAFLLSDVDRIISFFLTLVPMERRPGFAGLLHRIDTGLSGVVRGQITICVINGVLTLIGLLLLNVKFSFMLSTVAAVLSLIPIFGSIVSSIPIVAVALTDGFQTGLLALLWIIGIHLAEANFLNPKIMGNAARIHPVLVVTCLLAGEHFYGFTGALFAVPVTSVGITVFKSILARALHVQDDLLLEEPQEPPAGREAAGK